MSSNYSGFLTKSIVFLALVMIAMGTSLYMGKSLGRNIMDLTRQNIDQRFGGETPTASDENNEYVLGEVGGRSGFGYSPDEFGGNQFPREWADPDESQITTAGTEEPAVELEVLDTPSENGEETPAETDEAESTGDAEATEKPASQTVFDLTDTEIIFRIQVGTFEQRENAENVWRRLTQAGFDARISTYTENDATKYRVQVGDYPSQEVANQVAEELRSMNFNAWVFPVD
jgi:cell division protein FtsN